MEGVVVQNGLLPGSSWPNNQFTRYENNNQGNYLEQMRGSLMVVATVIASLTFQIAINPPGGVWQSDTDHNSGCAHNICKAGTSILATGDNDSYNKYRYKVFIVLCTISFSASQTIIVLLICGFGLRNKLIMWLLIIVTCVSVFCTAGAYVISLRMILPFDDETIYHILLYYMYFWLALIGLLVLTLASRFVFWLLKKFFRFICCC
ncbi:unnamed protein product [Trifolium pratense]|uniref:Uncharacterized protein n=1 Tax=Trifolium pratense TaxID=57577 RepID=A0ACB0LRR5_TRIPR|nr:unnamed protein product [Trifolium pratense]